MLEIGVEAPGFTLPDQNGTVHSLSDYRGQKVILYFYLSIGDKVADAFRTGAAWKKSLEAKDHG